MSGTLPTIDYTARDYYEIKAALERHVQLYFPNDWSDFLNSNLGEAILQLSAYVGDLLGFYLDRQANECYLSTAVQRANIVKLAEQLGYTPSTATAALVPLQCTIELAQVDPVVLAAYSVLSDKAGVAYELLENVSIDASVVDTVDQPVTGEVLTTANGTDRIFSLKTANDNVTLGSVTLYFTISTQNYVINVGTDGSITLPLGGSGTLDHDTGEFDLAFAVGGEPDAATTITVDYQWSQRITAYEGRTYVNVVSSDGTPSQRFQLPRSPVLVDPLVRDEDIDPNPLRLEVWEGDPAPPFGTSSGTEWTRVDSLVTAAATDEVYQLLINEDDEVTVLFGDGTNGKIPPSGTDNFSFIYRVGGGLRGNIAIGYLDTTLTGTAGLATVTVKVYNYQTGSGGAERETADEIRINAPRWLKTNETATTEEDYDTLSAGYVLPGGGTIARAKSRLTPAKEFIAYTVHTGVLLGTYSSSPTLAAYFRLPAAPLDVSSIRVYYRVSSVSQVATAVDLGGGVARLTGVSIDAANRLRYDATDYFEVSPAGFSGDGTTIAFNTTTPLSAPIYPGSVVLAYTIGGTDYIGYDDGNGELIGANLFGPSASGNGTIDYITGAVALRFGSQATKLSGDAETYNFQAINAGGDVYLNVDVDGAGMATITFTSAAFANFAAATAAECETVINGVIAGLASVESGKVRLTSPSYGVASSLEIGAPANDANDEFNFATPIVNGVDYPPDASTLLSFTYEAAIYFLLTALPDALSDVTMDAQSGPTTEQLPTNNIEVYTWSFDAESNLIAPSDALKDSLKTYLDLKRVLGTSVEILSGFNVEVTLYLTITYDVKVSVADTNTRIITALEEFFASQVNVEAGSDVPLASVYNALYPLFGVEALVIQDVALRVPVGTGDGTTVLFRDDSETPGAYVSTGKLPMVSGADEIKAYRGTTETGTSDASTPVANLVSAGGLMSSSWVNVNTGDFEMRFTTALARGEIASLEFKLDEVNSGSGVALWNIAIEEWEIAALGRVYVNGTLIS